MRQTEPGAGPVSGNNGKLDTFDYFYDVPEEANQCEYIEVQFKNTRKEYYLNSLHLSLKKGDMVAVEASPGHDVGRVALTGRLVALRMQKQGVRIPDKPKIVYRIARPQDLAKYEESKAKEHETMLIGRQLAKRLGLEMKIGDVEYQGDGQKAIFYYIADRRVDFRQLIRDLAEALHVRIEMRQIGARQEAGRIGGVGPCGRQLCCSSWMTGFHSVSANVARVQDLAINPQKLAGQCAKLKCCLNYERATYAEAKQSLPPREIRLECETGTYRQIKADCLAGQVTYVPVESGQDRSIDPVTITVQRALEVIEQNRHGMKPASLLSDSEAELPTSGGAYRHDLLSEESLSRFDRPGRKTHPKRKSHGGSRKRRPTRSSDRSDRKGE